MPSEKAEDFYELLNGVREDLTPQGTIENRIIVDLTHLFWKKARVNRLTQLLIRQTPVAAQIVASGKRTIKGICAHLASPIDENDGFDVSLEQAESLRSTISDENIADVSDVKLVEIADEAINRALRTIAQRGITDVRRPESITAGALSSLVDELRKCTELDPVSTV